jgi:hypothetical protein
LNRSAFRAEDGLEKSQEDATNCQSADLCGTGPEKEKTGLLLKGSSLLSSKRPMDLANDAFGKLLGLVVLKMGDFCSTPPNCGEVHLGNLVFMYGKFWRGSVRISG